MRSAKKRRPDSTARRVRAVYDDHYAELYPRLYIDPWPDKHELNLQILQELVCVSPSCGRWLDLACGQAWHFSQTGAFLRKLGVDLSLAQLERARTRNPSALFILADMSEVDLPPARFDLVTAFWAGYCYLDSEALIESWLCRTIAWTRPGGSIYLEVLQPEDLTSFNRSRYSERTGFRVRPRSQDFVRWSYQDAGGEHRMTSPPLERFRAPLVASFERVDAIHDGRFMVHLVATGKKAR